MEPAKLTGKLAPAREYLEQLRQLAAAEGLTVQELAFSFVHGLQSVDSIVFGAVNPGQVRETVQLLELPPLAGHVTAKVHALFSQVPEDIITPGSWGSR